MTKRHIPPDVYEALLAFNRKVKAEIERRASDQLLSQDPTGERGGSE